MALVPYTSADEVRGVLGVEDDELTNEVLALKVYTSALMLDFDSVKRGSLKVINTTLDKEEAEEPLTEAEENLLRVTNLFATYSVAQHLTTSLPMFGPRSITDGKASMSRFSDGPFRDTIEAIGEQYARFRKALLDALNEVEDETGDTTSSLFLVGVVPAYDPVTGQ